MKKIQIRNAAIMLVVSIALVFGIGFLTKKEEVSYKDGKYQDTATGMHEGLWVEVVLEDGKITSVEVIAENETKGKKEPAISTIPGKIVEANSPYVDTVSGATKTSEGIKNAVAGCLQQAAGEKPLVYYSAPAPKEDPTPLGYTYNAGTYTLTDAVECWSESEFDCKATVIVTLSEDSIVSIEMKNVVGDPCAAVQSDLTAEMVKWQTYEVDVITGSTYSSNDLKEAVQTICEQNKK